MIMLLLIATTTTTNNNNNNTNSRIPFSNIDTTRRASHPPRALETLTELNDLPIPISSVCTRLTRTSAL